MRIETSEGEIIEIEASEIKHAIAGLLMTSPASLKALVDLGVTARMPEPSPYERGVLDRYQDRGQRRRVRRSAKR